MPFGVVRGVDRGMGVLDEGCDRRREGAVLEVNLKRPIVTNGVGLCDALFSNYFEDLLSIILLLHSDCFCTESPFR